MEKYKSFYIFTSLVVIIKNCIGTEMHLYMAGNNGEIRSPNYPQDYPLNFTCTWTLQAGKGRRIRLQFFDFKIEKAKRCIYDSVQIKDRKNAKWNTKSVLKLCGSELPGTFLSRGRLLQVRFQSDRHNLVERGFLAKWRAEGGPKDDHKPCTTTVTALPKSRVCPTPSRVVVTKSLNCLSQKITPTPCSCSITRESKLTSTLKSKLPLVTTIISTTSTTQVPKIPSSKVSPEITNRVDSFNEKGKSVASKSQGLKEDKIILIVFIAFVSLLLLINVLLIFFLWRRNKQVGELRMISKNTAVQLSSEEYSDSLTPRRPNRGRYDYKTVPSTSGSSNGNTVKSVNKYIDRILRSNRYDAGHSQVPTQQNPNQDKFLSMLTDVIRPAEMDMHSLSSDTNDGDVSDEYVSTELSDHMTPYNTSTK